MFLQWPQKTLKLVLFGVAYLAGVVLIAMAQITLDSMAAEVDPAQTAIDTSGVRQGDVDMNTVGAALALFRACSRESPTAVPAAAVRCGSGFWLAT